VELLDVETVREDSERLIGNVAIEVSLGQEGAQSGDTAVTGPAPRVLAGFENHGGRTHLGSGAHPFGRVLKGYGNDGRSGMEGARRGNTIGTYLHGPLLPKNAWFADWLIARALAIEPDELAPLDDALEREAHLGARRAAGV
jgi:lipid II isoglutaminyl synthase (glutamine-hydrolysing)